MTDDTTTLQPDEQAMVETLVTEPRNEDERVRAWRAEQFVRLGYDLELAEELAGTTIDWHDADRFIRSGCSLELAVAILR
jgi:hypothetical protein